MDLLDTAFQTSDQPFCYNLNKKKKPHQLFVYN